RIQPWQSLRIKGYLALAESNPFFAHRLHIPEHLYTSVADYLRTAWSFPIFEISRDGMIYYPVEEGLTTAEFAAAGSAHFADLAGQKVTLSCTVADLATGAVCYWPAVRIKVRLDDRPAVPEILAAVASDQVEPVLLDGGRGCFIEIRHLPSMGREESFSWLAMVLGWLHAIDGVHALVQSWTLDEVRSCADEVLTAGWSARMQGRTLQEWGADALDLATGALDAQPLAPVGALGILAQRLAAGTCPATDTIKVLREHGLTALTDRLKLG
ncbi:MAG: hypothetical protein ACRDSH_00520, partial [Pseudonocardiaceae bacterium]